ncbi:hypothetical protein S7711_05111 [Stachybotrys chartarum IBT 7711]|uniref:LsmAD domain-containing protein n=1 Tax=Stachybotrys chartarum (strain CBS 109288 / IBT 7711) TaxID=1280523 RepID=A0A084ANW2_STACB|nr:hypothetical protein S7711_05111 [Stachybotrys chartarum IBT 7711]
MPLAKKDGMAGGGKGDGRAQNGNRSNFRTDQAISNSRFGNERVLKPWVPDATDSVDDSLEKTTGGGHWDQFAENERLFGLKTDYDENMYTTVIDKSHPQYRQRFAAAEKKAREIERSAPTTAHVAEERVMDFAGSKDQLGEDEEDKYSGVRRQEFPSLPGGRENRYTPPAKRAPTGQSSVKGAPVDPAIIDAQIRVPSKKQPQPVSEQPKTTASNPAKNGVVPKDGPTSGETKTKAPENKAVEAKPAPQPAVKPASTQAPTSDAASTPAKTAAAVSRNMSPGSPRAAPSATSTVERDVLKDFKNFANQQRINAEMVQRSKLKADKEVKLTELKKFASSFKLSTPVPNDLVSIIAKDPAKQKEIQAKAMKNAEEMAKAKAESATKEKPSAAKETPSKVSEHAAAAPAAETRPARAPAAPQSTPTAGAQNRNAGSRQPYNQQSYHNQGYRNNRGPPHGPQQQQTGNLAQRIRNMEHHKYSQPGHPSKNAPGPEMRLPPTGPANDIDQGYNRRFTAVSSHVGAKLNPNSHEFKPSAFAATFSPNGHISTSSSPRSTVNNVAEPPAPAAATGQLIRRKTKAVDPSKCCILSHIKTIVPPPGRNWNENAGLVPSYDTSPTWRQLQDDEKPDSTMHLTAREYFERQPFSGQSIATPNPNHAVPQLPHQHQLPFHLQHGGHNMGSRQSPHIPPMQMHTPQHSHIQHQPSYGNDDHRMMHSASAQSFASPRLGHAPVAYPGVHSPAQVPYNQPVFMAPGTPQMGQYRSFSNTPQYMPPQQGQIGAPMMMQPQFIPGPQGMVATPQMMYPGAHPQFIPSSGPPQAGPGTNGYPSPGRPTAPMMVHQGSQQGQPMYGMSPNVQYSQPAYGPGQHGGPMNNGRGYNGPGPQHFGTSPQQVHQYGSQHRNGSASYNKNYQAGPGQHQGPQANNASPAAPQSRPSEGSDEAK